MKTWLPQVAGWLLAIVFAIWLMQATEWVDEQRPGPAKGEALTNRLYGAQSLLRVLGATVVRQPNLSEMPPPGGRLILLTRHWNLFEGRKERLQGWIENGGHLIVPGWMLRRTSLENWLPLSHVSPPRQKKPAKKEKDQPEPPVRGDCTPLAQSPNGGERYFGEKNLSACGTNPNGSFVPQSEDQQPLWSMKGPNGAELLRVPFGRGTVTVIADIALLENDDVLKGDNPLIMVAALQAARGADIVFVAEESREPFMGWIWHQGWVAIVLAALALAAALWRAASRFGPLAQPVAHGRRSIAEQVRGTAAFLRRNGGPALHTAERRALSEAAARRLHRAERTPTEYARAVAAATGLDGAALVRALAIRPRNSATLAADLKLLEIARRRLEADPAGPLPAARAAPSSKPETLADGALPHTPFAKRSESN